MSFFHLENYLLERMHEIWKMRANADHISAAINNFCYQEIQCSACRHVGLTKTMIYDIPQYLLLKVMSNDGDCADLIDEVNSLVIQSLASQTTLEYNAQTAMIVLDDDEILYLRKSGSGYSCFDKSNGRFQMLPDLTAQQTGLASSWTVFVYETRAIAFDSPQLKPLLLDQTSLQAPKEPEECSIDTVQGLLRIYAQSLSVNDVEMEQKDVKLLLNSEGDLNDLIIDAQLSTIASAAPSGNRVLAMPTHQISQIINYRLNRFGTTLEDYDALLCPVNQNHHWYLIIIDIKQKVVVQLDSLLTVNLPRTQNMNRLLHFLDIQHSMKHDSSIDFNRDWKLATPLQDLKLQQDDLHSCGVHLLVHAEAYLQRTRFPLINKENICLYRNQIAETLLRKSVNVMTEDDWESVSA